MLHQAFGSDVLHVLATSSVEFLIPAQLSHTFLPIQVFNCILNGSGSFFSSQRGFSRLLEQESLEATEHLAEVRHKGLGILSEFVYQVKNLPIHLSNVLRGPTLNHFQQLKF